MKITIDGLNENEYEGVRYNITTSLVRIIKDMLDTSPTQRSVVITVDGTVFITTGGQYNGFTDA